MAGTERKVLQKYYTPDFDASKVSRIRTKKSFYFMQRATVPFNIQYLPLVWRRLKSKEIYKIQIIRLKVNLIEQKASSITDDVKAQEKVDKELLDSLFKNKNESLSSTKIVEEVVGEITDSDESSDDELRHHYL
uniref:Uncharacterized protein n=1 Tax=Strongyloides venezuelensis TaxID=75913 RepID=A0A0K0FJ94_STRVS